MATTAPVLLLLSLGAIGSIPTRAQSQSAYYEEPQPLVHMLNNEAGSGDGSSWPSLRLGGLASADVSSSVSPSLITAKCWNNNYQNDNDCKHLNVLTASGPYEQSGELGTGNDDDSIITPIVIFESTSSLEQATQQPPYLANKPLTSTTSYLPTFIRPAESSTSSRRPATANDVYAAPPATATRLPPPDDDDATRRWQQLDYSSSTSTQAPTSVATPRPRKPPKTSTAGRRCRDQNDADCDEPDETNNDDLGNDISPPATEELGSGERPVDDNDDEGDDDDGAANADDDGQDTGYDDDDSSEDGAGGGGDDDDDADDEGSSGTSDVGTGELANTPRYVDVITESLSTQQPAEIGEQTPPPATGAEIEVVVHPTMPPIFQPTASTQTTQSSDQDLFVASREQPTSSSTTTTPMPDDTFKSKPVFPPSTEQPPESDSELAESTTQKLAESDGVPITGDSIATTTEVDLATFKAVPMPPIEPKLGQRHHAKSASNNDSTELIAANTDDSDRVAERHKFTATPPPSASQLRPIQAPNVATREQQRFEGAWREKPVRLNNGLASGQQQQQAAPSNEPWGAHHLRPPVSTAESTAQPRAQSEMLSTMLLYASIVILAVTASIFCLMAFAFWRRSSLRQMQKAALLNGRAGNQHMVGSMSHGSQLMANIQQPGLLSTYAPGKSLSMGKVTTSLTKPPDEGRLIAEEDEDGDLAKGGRKPDSRPNGGSSWSTSNEEQQTTASSSSGSQQINESQQPATFQTQQQRAAGAANRLQYPNSLSDGRQNSGSISDSQASSIEPDPRAPTQPYPMDTIRGYPMQQAPDQSQQLGPVYDPSLQGRGQVQYNPPAVQDPSKRFVAPSHSLEQLDQRSNGYVPYAPAPPKLMDTRQCSLQEPPMQHRSVYLPSPNGSPPSRLQFGGQYNPPAASDNYLINGNQPSPSRLGAGVSNNNNISIDFNNGQFGRAPISPARVAMNPLATLSRRYPPGVGLNRNIYSEDSSSLMTASPSLIRTSSSSSFAFNGSQHPTPSSIRAKPLVDAAGRVFNDYTQQAAAAPSSSGPPVLGRKDRSEAWYV